jgi:hypothetical protein
MAGKESGMNKKTKAKWLWLVLVPFFPVFFHPWWLFLLSMAVFSFLVWSLSIRQKEDSK